MIRVFFTSCVLLLCIGEYSHACTTFFLFDGQNAVFGRNYDWVTADGLLISNKRGLRKTSVVQPPNQPATWKSRYGSLTFNQYGREFPTGGMNEAGLVVELMWLDGTRYPLDSRPAVGGARMDSVSTGCVRECCGTHQQRIDDPYCLFCAFAFFSSRSCR
jgi:choloylglycine hydrolase